MQGFWVTASVERGAAKFGREDETPGGWRRRAGGRALLSVSEVTDSHPWASLSFPSQGFASALLQGCPGLQAGLLPHLCSAPGVWGLASGAVQRLTITWESVFQNEPLLLPCGMNLGQDGLQASVLASFPSG